MALDCLTRKERERERSRERERGSKKGKEVGREREKWCWRKRGQRVMMLTTGDLQEVGWKGSCKEGGVEGKGTREKRESWEEGSKVGYLEWPI